MKKPKKPNVVDARMTDEISATVAKIKELVIASIAEIEQTGIKKKPLEQFWLSPAQRDVLLATSGISKSLKNKLAKSKASFTPAEVTGMAVALFEGISKDEPQKKAASLLVAKHLLELLHDEAVSHVKGEAAKTSEPNAKISTKAIYQFKITLQGIEPSIWRRIQTKDCTLDKLHEHIQTAMGWTNSHLHQFNIDGLRYGDPQLLDDGFEEQTPFINSLRTKLSKIMPKDGKRLRFQYEYDFGDCWEHEILFEGFPPSENGAKYPLCVEGERACPPEDVGGTPGYKEFLRAIANPKHKRHKELMRWCGPFDPEKFDAEAATNRMKKGLPDWRNEA